MFESAHFDGLDAQAQSEIMRDWFLENYEDPVHSLPYDSREGGYIWVDGGPYDAGQVLHDTFGEFVSEAIIDRLARDLCDESPEWIERADLIDDHWSFFFALDATAYFEEYLQSMHNHRVLLKLSVPEDARRAFDRMMFVNLITIMEAYLSDAFIGSVLGSERAMRRFVSSTPSFQEQKISFAEIYETLDTIESTMEKHLRENVIWHRLNVVKNMYRDALGIAFPQDLGDIFRAIKVRHTVVHRNGKIDGEEVNITEKTVADLSDKIDAFIRHIERRIQDIFIEESLLEDHREGVDWFLDSQ